LEYWRASVAWPHSQTELNTAEQKHSGFVCSDQ
jgi:hypothetical protein